MKRVGVSMSRTKRMMTIAESHYGRGKVPKSVQDVIRDHKNTRVTPTQLANDFRNSQYGPIDGISLVKSKFAGGLKSLN